MKDLAFATISELKELLANKKITSSELLDYFIKRFEQYDPKIESALQIFDKASIEKVSRDQGTLAGIPGIIKDNICQKGRITSCASKILQNFTATYDATAIARLKQEGGLLIGRANCDEFAMGSSTETSAFKKTKNPWDISRVPGGSSGGAAAAVAAGLVPWALGSETGGSVRQPASLCGIVGFKPTYGLISRSGLVAYASSLDQIGVLTRSVYDAALVFSIIAGHDEADSSSLPVASKNYTQNITKKLKNGITIGIIENMLEQEELDNQVRAAIDEAIKQFEQLGVNVVRLPIPILDYGAAIYFILSRAEAASNLARYDGVLYGYRASPVDSLEQMYEKTRQEGFGQEVKARIMIGNYVLSVGHADEYYKNAIKAQQLMRGAFEQIFKEVDVLLAPTQSIPAFTFGAFDKDKLQMDLQDYFTCPANIAGIPAISIPCGFTKDKLPIGVQLIGAHLSEELLFQMAYAYEQATPWHTMHPPNFE